MWSMRMAKTIAALLLFAGAILVPATTAQATTAQATTASACAPTAESQWLGTFRGPHQWTTAGGGSTGVSDIELSVVQDSGQLKVWRHGYVVWASTADGLLNMSPTHPFLGLDTTSATCGTNGQVVGFSGTWFYRYNWPECWGCAVGGTFEVTRA